MNGRKPGETSGSVLSFTYLDVLVCTMGSLLLMLVMFGEKAKRAAIAESQAHDAKAIAAASQEPTSAPPSPDDPQALAKLLAEVEAHQAKLQRMRDQAREQLEDEQQRATHSEEQQRSLEHDLAKLNLTLRALQSAEEKQTVDQDVAEKELQRLAKLVADTENRVDEMRKEGAGKRSYAIVPYKGPNGTNRRPIFIECTHDAIIIQPEGVKLTETDFEGPIGAGNPLAAAIRAAHEELNARARAAGETDPPDPYPLFIVRPDGVNAYEVALAATRSWDSDFGYEFVDADWKLEYPQADARLAQITEHAIEQARERQKLLALAAPSRYSGRMTGRAGGGGGGRGRTGSGGSLGGEGDGEFSGGGPSSVQLAGGTTASSETFAEQAAQASAAGGNGSGYGGAEGQKYDNRYGELGPGGAPVATGYPGGPGDIANNSSQKPTEGSSGDGRYGEGAPGGTSSKGATTPMANGSPGGASDSTSGQPGQGAAASSSSYASAKSGAASSSSTSTSAGGSSGTGNQAPEPFDPHAAPGSAARQAAQNGMASPNGSPEGAATIAVPGKIGKDKNVESAAKSRGANWANSDASQRSSAITRPIQVMIRPDQLAILDPNDYTTGGAVVPFNQPSERVLDQLAAAIKRQVADWGIAGRGMYWRPELVFVVAPGAEPHASRLAALLDDSGVDVRLPATSGSNVAARPQEGARATR